MRIQYARCLEKYDNTLKERNELDFNDMINFATELISQNKPKYSYKYIIIDEYQDISFSRFKLIMEIRELSGARLVCVGDDRQSIYRFAGSDISLFCNFGKYFESQGKSEVKGFEEIDISYLTAHRSKGTEADNVIVLKLRNHLLGFPNKMTDDPLLSPLLRT
ncbi:hypothetical protein GCM10007415_42380 [Parapedobacter pyrenivorans]|uniref:UvrD-like helicase ATP-binding domain-containing protein n=1 Tax=Parapedobacter pyrenivorans TaxID=1305674 RepID=A0A917MGV0_9SPHI|nr:UvrD-helicase domain-containing protein [Parapedobacter pyrenivorans]GGH01780.1 hypothetical protein GCM10007415_42380 [Parapedobacter pyrenivorans]